MLYISSLDFADFIRKLIFLSWGIASLYAVVWFISSIDTIIYNKIQELKKRKERKGD